MNNNIGLIISENPISRSTIADASTHFAKSLCSLREVLQSMTLSLPATLLGITALKYKNGELKRYQPRDENEKQGESWFLGFKVHVWSAITEACGHLVQPFYAFFSCIGQIFSQPLFMALRLSQGVALTLLVAEKMVMSAPVKLACGIRGLVLPPSPSLKAMVLPDICTILNEEKGEDGGSPSPLYS